jgi:phosphoglycolate phosphatase
MRRRTQDAVLLDLDGVLVDSRAAISGCLNHALAANGLPEHTEAALHRFIGPPLALTFSELTEHAPDSALVVSCITAYRERYVDASLRDTTVVPGIADALADVGRRYRLAVATSKALAFAEPILTALELRDFFDFVAGPSLSAQSEDKAATIGAALTGLQPDRTVMVGDRSFDVAGAHARGLPAIGVTWGIGDRDELTSAGADAIIDAPAELPAAISILMRAQDFAARHQDTPRSAAATRGGHLAGRSRRLERARGLEGLPGLQDPSRHRQHRLWQSIEREEPDEAEVEAVKDVAVGEVK